MTRKRYVYIVFEIYEGQKYYQNQYGEWDCDYQKFIREVFGTEKRAKKAIREYEKHSDGIKILDGVEYLHSYMIQKHEIH